MNKNDFIIRPLITNIGKEIGERFLCFLKLKALIYRKI